MEGSIPSKEKGSFFGRSRVTHPSASIELPKIAEIKKNNLNIIIVHIFYNKIEIKTTTNTN
jgi:hypothetical protein